MAASPNGQQRILSVPSPWKWFQRPCFLFMFTSIDWSIDMLFLSLLRLWHYVKSVQIRSFPGPYFPIFGLNTEIYGINLCIQSEYGNIRTRKKLDTFHAVWKREFQLLIWLVFNCQYTKSYLKCIKSGGSKISQDLWIWTNFTKLCTLEITWISLFAKWSARVFFPFNWYFVLGVEPRLYRPA